MQTFDPWNNVRGSFLTPVVPPDVDPDASPHIAITINCAWLAYVRGALTQLLLDSVWKTPDEASRTLALQRANTLIAQFVECSTDILPFACPYDFVGGTDGWFDRASQSGDAPPASAFWDFAFGAWIETTHPAGAGIDALACDIVKLYSTPVHLTSVDFSYFLTKGPLAGGLSSGVALYSAGFGALLGSNIVGASTLPDVSIGSFSWSGDVSGVSIVRLIMTADSAASGSTLTGGAHIFNANVRGIGSAECA